MKYAGRTVKKPKFEIGDRVRVNGLRFTGKIGHAQYRYDEGAQTGWFYKVRDEKGGGYLSWSEKDLRKVRGK